MATVNKDFKIKSGLIVEGTTATVNGYDVLTKKPADDNYIIDLIGGETLVKSVSNEFDVSVGGELSIDRATVDAYYDAAGSAATAQSNAEDYADGLAGNYDAAGTAATEAGYVASDLSDHVSDISAHGVTGNVVGTSDTQTLTNKTIGDTLNFTGAGAMTINSDSHIVLTPAAGSSVKWGADILATQGYADQAETDAKAYTDARETAITTAYESYADTAETDAVTTANSYTDGRETAITTAYQGYADQAELDAVATANAYTDTEVAALVDTAPALLDTLNELAAAIADNPNYATDTANAVAGRVAKSGDTMTGDLVLPGAPTLTLHAATKGYVDQAETDAATSANSYTDGEIATALTTAQGYADTAEQAAKDYADTGLAGKEDALTAAQFTNKAVMGSSGNSYGLVGTSEYLDVKDTNGYNKEIELDIAAVEAKLTADGYAKQSDIATALSSAEDYADALTTSDVEEGTAQYFTDARAKSSAADLLTGASLTNITITGTGAGLTITAENGVADSDTDDLVEGTTNLYFTDARAVDALEAVVPNFTAVELNSVAKQVAATLSAPTAGIQVAHAFDKTDYRSAEYLVKVAYGTHTEISKVLLTLDSSDNIAITEYGIVGTNGSASSISAGISGSNVQLQVTTANNNSTVTVVGTLVA
jgi:hypothetical protein